jgi:hypothetical protein
MRGVQTSRGRMHRVAVPYLRLSNYLSTIICYVASGKNQVYLVTRLGLAQIDVRARSIRRMPEVRNQGDGVSGRYIRSAIAISKDLFHKLSFTDPDLAVDRDGRVGEKIPAHVAAADISPKLRVVAE